MTEDVRAPAVKPPPERLYGRQRGHPLRPRQERLLEEALPRLRFPLEKAGTPNVGFGKEPSQIWFEVGFGGGEHSYAQHAAYPEVGYIASEVFHNGLCSLLTRLVPVEEEATAPIPDMLRLWDDDARILLKAMPQASVDRLFLMFPDPWPKAKHAKRRFVHPHNVELVARVLKPGAVWRVASDDPTYQAWVEEVMGAQPYFDAPPPVTERPQGWFPTRYEAKAIAAGRQPLYWTFTRR